MRRLWGHVLLFGGAAVFLGLVAVAVLGLWPFAPFWAFVASAAAMAGAALRQPDLDPPATSGRSRGRAAPDEGGGEGAGGALDSDAGADGGEAGGPGGDGGGNGAGSE